MQKTLKLTYIAIMISTAMILSYIESLLPVNFGISGIKLGLANAAVVTVLYLFGTKTAAFVSLCRILLSSLLFGGMSAFIYSVAGGAISFVGMVLLKKTNKFNIVSVSAVGGVLHNLGQLAVALAVFETVQLVYYAPVLIIAGVLTGVFIGIVSALLIKKLPAKIYEKYNNSGVDKTHSKM